MQTNALGIFKPTTIFYCKTTALFYLYPKMSTKITISLVNRFNSTQIASNFTYFPHFFFSPSLPIPIVNPFFFCFVRSVFLKGGIIIAKINPKIYNLSFFVVSFYKYKYIFFKKIYLNVLFFLILIFLCFYC